MDYEFQFKTEAIDVVCAIHGTQGYSAGSDEELTYDVSYKNVLDDQIEDYNFVWECTNFNEDKISADDCFENNYSESLATLKNPDQYEEGQILTLSLYAIRDGEER